MTTTSEEWMSVWIEFPCGCQINETSVIAMCIKHVHELAHNRRQKRKTQSDDERVMRQWFDQVIVPNGEVK